MTAERDAMSHYIEGLVEMLEARESGDEELEDSMIDDLDDRWARMTDDQIDLMKRWRAVRHASHEVERRRIANSLKSLQALIIDVMVAAHDWKCGAPDSMREEDYWSGAWDVADDILETLADGGFDWKKRGLIDPDEVRKKKR